MLEPSRNCRSRSISSTQTIVCGNRTFSFTIDPVRRTAAAQRLGRYRADRELSRPHRGVQGGRPHTPALGRAGRALNGSSPLPQVVIAGAGPVGLTAALLLGTKDISVTVLEAERRISEELRASTFHPPTLDMMAPYGITERMVAAGLICPTWQIRLHPSGERAVFDLAMLAGETDHPYRLQCEQSKYCQIVLCGARRAAERIGLASRRRSPACSNPPTSSSLRVVAGRRAMLRWRTTSSAPTARAARCARRSTSTMSGDIYPETTILATTHFPFHERLEDLSNVSYCWKPNGTFSLLRLPGVWRASLYAREGQSIESGADRRGLARTCCTTSCRMPTSTYWRRGPTASTGGSRRIPQGPRLPRRRRRAPQQPIGRHGHERRHPRRLQSRRKADRGAAGRRRRAHSRPLRAAAAADRRGGDHRAGASQPHPHAGARSANARQNARGLAAHDRRSGKAQEPIC